MSKILPNNPKTTPLFEEQKKAGGRFMLFHGWKLPREFSSATKEHLNVRKNAGLFDISHMGEIRVKGHGALSLLQKTLTNQIDKLKKNQAQYNLMCNEKGGVIDDLMLYCLEPKKDYLLCVNADCVKKDFNWLNKQNTFKAIITDESNRWAGLSLQGPKALDLLTKAFCSQTTSILKNMKKNQCQWVACLFKKDREENSFLPTQDLKAFNDKYQPVLVSATGYTGERGFEIFLPPQIAPILWRNLLEVGKGVLCLVGLLGRDTLRLESQYPLYGQELNEDIDPHSAGLSWVVKNKSCFIGSKALSQIKVRKKRIAFKLASPARVPRTGNRLFFGDQVIGEVSSGAFSPTLSAMIGMGYVLLEKSTPSTKILVEIQEELYPALIVTHFL